MENKKCFIVAYFFLSVLPICINAQEITTLYNDKNSVIRLTDIRKHENIINIGYEIQNNSSQSIWFCAESNFTQKKLHSQIIVDDIKGKVYLKINNPEVPENVYFTTPIAKIFKKISSKERLNFELNLEFPIYDNIPYSKDDKNRKLSFEELQSISIELGFYRNLQIEQFQPIIDDFKAIDGDEIIINCFSAKENPSEKIFFTIERKLIKNFLKSESQKR